MAKPEPSTIMDLKATDLTEIVASGDLTSLKARLSGIPDLSGFVNMPMDGGGATLLHLAANSTIDVLCFLLDASADPHCQTEDGLTPLHIAAMWGRKDLVNKLLSFGADPYSIDNEGLMPIDYARNESHQACVDLLECESDDSYEHVGSGHCDLDQTCAESFIAMFETLTVYGDASILNYPDVVEDTLQASLDEHYLTAVCSPSSPITKLKPDPIAVSPGSSSLNKSVEEMQTTISAEIQKLSNAQIRERLISLGEKPGPINESTRLAYMVYLTKLESGERINAASSTTSKDKHYKYELALVLNGISPLPNVRHLEAEVVREFAIPSVSSRTGVPRTPVRDNFNYLLLDPQHIKNSTVTLDQSSDDLSQFRQFIEAVFYVGKGKNARPMQHLKDAKTALSNGQKLNSKLDKIASIWRQGFGVISLPMYHNTHSGEAFTRECCMIDTIGLDNLTNQVRGHLHGAIQHWSLSKRRQYGVYLLNKAFRVFTLTGPPQIRQQDL